MIRKFGLVRNFHASVVAATKKTIQQLEEQTPGILNNASVLLRVDFNVPIRNGTVVDDTRIRRSLETIKYVQQKPARPLFSGMATA